MCPCPSRIQQSLCALVERKNNFPRSGMESWRKPAVTAIQNQTRQAEAATHHRNGRTAA